MKKRGLCIILALILCAGLLPAASLADDYDPSPVANHKPEPKKVTYFNNGDQIGDEPSLQLEYEDTDGNNWVEVYLIGDEVKEGDKKGELGLIKFDGKTYHLRGIQTIDSSNSEKFYKDAQTGRWIIAKTPFYLAGETPPQEGEKVGVVIETGPDSDSMVHSEIVEITVPEKGKSTVVDGGGSKDCEHEYKWVKKDAIMHEYKCSKCGNVEEDGFHAYMVTRNGWQCIFCEYEGSADETGYETEFVPKLKKIKHKTKKQKWAVTVSTPSLKMKTTGGEKVTKKAKAKKVHVYRTEVKPESKPVFYSEPIGSAEVTDSMTVKTTEESVSLDIPDSAFKWTGDAPTSVEDLYGAVEYKVDDDERSFITEPVKIVDDSADPKPEILEATQNTQKEEAEYKLKVSKTEGVEQIVSAQVYKNDEKEPCGEVNLTDSMIISQDDTSILYGFPAGSVGWGSGGKPGAGDTVSFSVKYKQTDDEDEYFSEKVKTKEEELQPVEVKTYVFTEEGYTWQKGSGAPLKMTVKGKPDDTGTFEKFKGIQADEKDLPEGSYTAESGSVKLTLAEAWLETLDAGAHKLVAFFADGKAETTFTVTQKAETGDKVEAFVSRCYKLILSREPDEGGLKGWSEALKSKTAPAARIIDGFVRSEEYVSRKLSNGESVDILYRTMLDREADADGKASWVDALTKGYTLQNIIDGFCGSVEFTKLCNEYGIEPGRIGASSPAAPDTPRGKIEAFVMRCYKLILNRDADQGGLQGWSDALESGAGQACQIIDGFVRSEEYVNRKLDYGASVDILYKTMLNRDADPDGRAGWVDALSQGYTLQHIINGFCGSAEFTAICNDYGISAGTLTVASALVKREAITPEGDEAEAPVVYQGYNSEFINEEKIRAFVEHCYVAVFGREGDTEGVENYTKLILNGKKTPKSVAREFVFSAEFQGKLPGNEEFIRILYRLYFDREPGADELAGWVKMLENGASLEEIVNGFAGSAEFKAIVNAMKE